ncbi:MAG: hypothetical protein CR959_02335, partial [Fusobacteriales bacterium]
SKMKKVLIGLFALASISAFANEGINVYGKVGLDVVSKFTVLKDEDDSRLNTPKKGKIGANFAVEVTKDVTPNLEFGAGLAYTVRKDSDMKINNLVDEDGDKVDLKIKLPRYESIPLYLTGKYNFNVDSEVKPYIKADLGYSFNQKIKAELSGAEDKEDNFSETGKVENGLYTSIGLGLEYNHFITDLAYVHTNARVKNEDGGEADRYNNDALRLSVGYKFNF